MKPPDDPRPSGDRTVARLLIAALTAAGHQVDLASRMRTRDGRGDPERQARLRDLGARLAARYVRQVEAGARPRPDAWLTYHLYYKAADWIGPEVSARLGIPYAVAEASVAHKRAGGPWNLAHRRTLDCLARAELVIGLNSRDRVRVAPEMKAGARYLALRPFLQLAPEARPDGPTGDPVRLLAVGMMRAGDKTASYLALAEALAQMPADVADAWRLTIIGDGPERGRIEAAFARLAGRVQFLGALTPEALAAEYARHDLFVWPAIREAFGMALLEAQSAGLAAVAGAAGGVPDILRDGETGLLAPEGDVAAFAARLAELIANPSRIATMGRSALAVARRDHDLAAAAVNLDRSFREIAA